MGLSIIKHLAVVWAKFRKSRLFPAENAPRKV